MVRIPPPGRISRHSRNMELEIFIESKFKERNIPIISNKGINYLKIVCEGFREHCSPGTLTKFTNKYFPDKPKRQYIRTYLCNLDNKKCCPACRLVLDISNFNKNRSERDLLQVYCKSCEYEKEKPYSREKTTRRNNSKIQRMPRWADLEKIKEIYRICPEGYQVDHIIPLQGVLVSGLHVENNLQYLTSSENRSKSNSYTPI